MRFKPWLGCLILMGLIFYVYWPSFWHIPRSDQIVYLYAVSQDHSWFSLAFLKGFLNQTGTFAPGDERLFRPGFYFILGTEKFLWGYAWWLWQVFGVLMHGLACLCLWRLLSLFLSSTMAFVITIFMALNLMVMETVIFTHVNSYIVFAIMMLSALYQTARLIDEPVLNRNRFYMLGICCILGASIYELGYILVIMIGAALFWARSKTRMWGLGMMMAASIVLLMQTWRLGHHGGGLAINLKPLLWWSSMVLQGDRMPVMFGGRNMIDGVWVPTLSQLFSSSWVQAALLLFVFLLSLALFMRKKQAEPSYPRSILFILFICLMFLCAYASIIAWGRAAWFSLEDILRQNLHYLYIFIILAMVVVGLIGVMLRVRYALLNFLAAFLILSWSAFNAYRVNQILTFEKEAFGATRNLLYEVEREVRWHQRREAFTFDVDMDYPGHYPYESPFLSRRGFIELLYPGYIDHEHPSRRWRVNDTAL